MGFTYLKIERSNIRHLKTLLVIYEPFKLLQECSVVCRNDAWLLILWLHWLHMEEETVFDDYAR